MDPNKVIWLMCAVTPGPAANRQSHNLQISFCILLVVLKAKLNLYLSQVLIRRWQAVEALCNDAYIIQTVKNSHSRVQN